MHPINTDGEKLLKLLRMVGGLSGMWQKLGKTVNVGKVGTGTRAQTSGPLCAHLQMNFTKLPFAVNFYYILWTLFMFRREGLKSFFFFCWNTIIHIAEFFFPNQELISQVTRNSILLALLSKSFAKSCHFTPISRKGRKEGRKKQKNLEEKKREQKEF